MTEYWMIDHLRREFFAYHLNEEGVYIPHYPDNHGDYHASLLPNFALNIPILWQSPLPDLFAIAETVKAMVK